MPVVERHSPGNFCWFELATSDWRAARKFYTDLFGWGVSEVPMGPDSPPYVMLQKNGKDVGALYQMQSEEAGAGMQPNWLTYVSVASADETAKKAKSLGGNAIKDPFDVFDFGRMAVLRDPHGAVFAIWQAKKHAGARIVGEPGSFCWAELDTTDPKAAAPFYKSLFSWRSKDSEEYIEWISDQGHIGGAMKLSPDWGDVPPYWLNYIAVDDCDRMVKKAEGAGASAFVPPTDIPNAGRFAVLRDPQGAVFAIIKPSDQAK